ncbi:MAG: GNAT family N-acetyltransferase [Ruminococcus sp.]|nr:GNAT family N-acetyltransferase [Ruminococcus sp.]
MIYLCSDKDKVRSVIDKAFGCTCIRNTILLYLNSYGAQFEFAQFYIQCTQDANTDTALVLRYNQTVYCITEDCADLPELMSFFVGFTDTTLISDRVLHNQTNEPLGCETGAVMSKSGIAQLVQNPKILLCSEPKPVCRLVSEEMPEHEKTDFFLNTAHQMRHGQLSVYAYYDGLSPMSVASVFHNGTGEAVIPFVYTGDYFRGNGYSKQILSAVCSDAETTYQLLCEAHNIEFYKKCGFTQVSQWVKYSL